MSNLVKNFIYKNEEFECEFCKTKNHLLKGGIRNHCYKCLYSKHVDKSVPGDRKSNCLGLMPPLGIFHNSKKGWVLVHECLKCGKIMNNKTNEEDNMDLIIELTKKGYVPTK